MVLINSVFLLTACGIKPGHVSAPEGSTYQFPHPYPDPAEINK